MLKSFVVINNYFTFVETLKLNKMKESVKMEIAEHLVELINDRVLNNENIDDWHYHGFNENYYIIGYYNAEQWLKKHNLSAFEGIEICQEYENENFGESQIYSDAEKVVNMLAYIFGEELINEIEAENIEELKEELIEIYN